MNLLELALGWFCCLDSEFGLWCVGLVGFVAQGWVAWIEWLCFLVDGWRLMLLSFFYACFFGFDDSVLVLITWFVFIYLIVAFGFVV